MNRNRLRIPLPVALPPAFVVVALGARVRLSHAGLDWPGCHGQLLASECGVEIRPVNEAFPERHEGTAKACKEMIHRFAAGVLGLYEFGVQESDARAAIHAGHRLGAVITFACLVALCASAYRYPSLRPAALAILPLSLIRVALGFSNVLLVLRLPVAVAHNGVAALLMMGLVTLNYRVWFNVRPREVLA